jgi:hypothetical protein
MGRLNKNVVDIVAQIQVTVQYEVLRDSGQTIEDIIGNNGIEQGSVQSELLIESGQTVENSSGQSGTEPRDSIFWGTDRHWTDCRRQQWT